MKTAFLINGFHSQSTHESFDWLDKMFSDNGYKVLKPHIDWSYKVMSDNVAQFEDFYNNNKSEHNLVLGFSFGAVIAFISAPSIKSDELVLCSLSPYFKEDENKNNYIRYVGKKRLLDFEKYSAEEIAKNINSITTVFYGEKEASKYPDLKQRCEEVAKSIKNAKIFIAPKAPHDISDKGYIKTVKDSLILR